MQAWLDLWLRGDTTAATKLRSSSPTGAPIADVLSSKPPGPLDPPGAYQSSLYLPAVTPPIDCDDLVLGCP